MNLPFTYSSRMQRKGLEGLRTNRFREYEKSVSVCFSFSAVPPVACQRLKDKLILIMSLMSLHKDCLSWVFKKNNFLSLKTKKPKKKIGANAKQRNAILLVWFFLKNWLLAFLCVFVFRLKHCGSFLHPLENVVYLRPFWCQESRSS